MCISLNGSKIGSVDGPLDNVSFNLQDSVYDEVRGYLVWQNNSWNFIGAAQYNSYSYNKQCRKIALILESPHKDEYSENYVPLRPANGKTGNNINKKLSNRPYIIKFSQKYNYQILIMNPIQVQCSCYHQFKPHGIDSTSNITNKVFRCLFNRSKGNLRKDFISRLKQYEPDIVLNCSTYGAKSVVETAIKEAIERYSDHKDTHPSVW